MDDPKKAASESRRALRERKKIHITLTTNSKQEKEVQRNIEN